MRLLTNLIFEPKGMHDPALAYSIKDTVMSADGSRVYFALQDVPAGTALTDEDYWMLQIDLSGSKSSMDNAIADFANYAKEIGTKVRGETAKASGNPVTFLPDAGSLLQPVTVLEPQQEGSGDPSPENIRPFIGYNKLELGRRGKNIYSAGNISFSAGNAWKGRPFIALNSADDWVVGKTYTVSFTTDTAFKYTVMKRSAMNGIDATVGRNHVTFEVAYSNETSAFLFTNAVETGVNITDIMIEENAAITPFEPYKGKLHTVQIGQTVYGLRYEWLTGKGVVEWAMQEFDGSDDEKWIEFTNGSGIPSYQIYLPTDYPAVRPSYGDLPEAVCSHYTAASQSTLWQNAVETGFAIFHDANIVAIRDTANGASMDKFKTHLAAQKSAGTPVQVVWKLATPIEIQLTPHIISAADPEQTNTLYGDGSIEVEYVKPLHVSIEERVAAAVQAALATTE